MAHSVLTGGYLIKLQRLRIHFAHYLGAGILLINVLTVAQNCSFTCTHPASRKENPARGGAPLEWLLSGSFALVAFSVLEAARRYGVASFFFPFFLTSSYLALALTGTAPRVSLCFC